MLNKLKDLRVILIFLLIVSWVVAVILFMSAKNDSQEQIAAKQTEIDGLQTQLTEIGELTDAYIVAADVVSGKVVEETDITPVKVPIGVADNLPSSAEELIGQHFKMNMTTGSVISKDCVYSEPITSDMRYYDVIVDVLPIGIKEGSFVDIRLKYGTGADYIGIAHRQVVEVNGNCLKLVLTEEDIQMFSSMLVDSLVFSSDYDFEEDINRNGKIDDDEKIKIAAIGAYLYATEYVEGGIQDITVRNYAPSTLVQAIMTNDVNIFNKTYDLNDAVLKRQLFNASLKFKSGSNAIDFEVFAGKISEHVSKQVKDGQKAYEKRVEEELKAAAEGV